MLESYTYVESKEGRQSTDSNPNSSNADPVKAFFLNADANRFPGFTFVKNIIKYLMSCIFDHYICTSVAEPEPIFLLVGAGSRSRIF